MNEILNKLSFGNKLLIVISIGFVIGYAINAYFSIHHIEKVYMSETISKARAITIEAESAREYIGDLRKKYKAFDDVKMLAEVKEEMQGITGAENIIAAAKNTSFYWTVPIVSGWNVAMMKAKEANYVFRVPKISPRNPANEPNEIEREMLLEMGKSTEKEIYRVDEKDNVLRFMRGVFLSEDCLLCHGNINDSITGELKDPLGFEMEEWKTGEMHGAYEVVADLTPMQKDISKTLQNIILQAVLTIAAMIFIISLVVKGLVVKPILNIVGLTKDIADGNFTKRVTVDSQDEIGAISSAMNSMSQNLNNTINHVIDSSNELNSSAESIKGRSMEIETNAQQQLELVQQEKEMIQGAMESVIIVNDNVDDLYRAAEDVSSAIEETGRSIENVEKLTGDVAASVSDTSSAIEEMAVSIKNVAENTKDIVEAAEETKLSGDGVQRGIKDVATNASEINRAVQEILSIVDDLIENSNEVSKNSADAGTIAVHTADDAEKGREAMKKAILSMIKIKEVVSKSSEVISGLSRSAEDIGDIIDVIDDIAEQTNLLALNAAIEAARAGEHGRGFAVVADEVRKLAERSGSATKEIADLIKGIQGESEAAVHAMEEGTSEVEEGVKLAENSGKALENIISGVDKTENLVKEIARASEVQKTSSDEVSDSINNVSKQVSAITSATERLSKSGDDIVEKVSVIGAMSNQIANATEEQAEAANQVTTAVSRINDGSQHVKSAMQEQSLAVGQIVESVTSINSKCKEVKEASEHQRILFNEVVEATNSLEKFSNQNIETVKLSQQDVSGIVGKAESLKDLMAKFIVDKS